MNWLLNSSLDLENLSATISGLILSASAGIIFLAAHFNIVLGADQVSALAPRSASRPVLCVRWTLFGLIRKVVMLVKPTPPAAS
jgi:hypothetical protein